MYDFTWAMNNFSYSCKYCLNNNITLPDGFNNGKNYMSLIDS